MLHVYFTLYAPSLSLGINEAYIESHVPLPTINVYMFMISGCNYQLRVKQSATHNNNNTMLINYSTLLILQSTLLNASCPLLNASCPYLHEAMSVRVIVNG